MLKDRIILEHCAHESQSMNVLNATKEIEKSFPDIKRARILKVSDATRIVTLSGEVIGYLCFAEGYCFFTTKKVVDEQLPTVLQHLLPKQTKHTFFSWLLSKFRRRKLQQ